MTDYFIRDSSDEEEFNADEGSESDTELAVLSLRQTENGQIGNDSIRRQS